MKKLLANPSVKFIIVFLLLFVVFYYFNIYYFAVTTPTSRHYNAFIAEHLNYIKGLRLTLLTISTSLLNLMGFTTIHDDYIMLVAGHGSIQVVYKCLGLGVMSFFLHLLSLIPNQLRLKLYL